MSNFDKLLEKVIDNKANLIFESTCELDAEDVAYIESCRSIYVEESVSQAQKNASTKTRIRSTVSSSGEKFGDIINNTKRWEQMEKEKEAYDKASKEYLDWFDSALAKKEKTIKLAKAGKVTGIGALIVATVAAFGVIVKKHVDNKAIKEQVESLAKEAEELKSQADSGEISPNEAEKRINAIYEKIKSIGSKIKSKAAPVKESVDELKLDIFESCASGEITEEERDTLLGMI